MDVEVGAIYRHFKGHLYKVICLCKDTENLKDMVVYKNIETKECWVRNKEMFMSKVDKNKYPNVKQEYRFEKIGEE